VELLVVIGIIALLISILLPALSKARRSANTVVCQSNLRQIGVGLALYVTESKGFIPGPNTSGISLQQGSAFGGTADAPVQNWDWVSPTIGKMMGLVAGSSTMSSAQLEQVRLQRYQDIMELKLKCPENDTHYGEQYAGTALPMGAHNYPHIMSYMATSFFMFVPAASFSSGTNMTEDSGSLEFFQLPTDYVPKMSKIGDATSKIFAFEGARYWDPAPDNFFDYSTNLVTPGLVGTPQGNFHSRGPGTIGGSGEPYLFDSVVANSPNSSVPGKGFKLASLRHNGKMLMVYFDGHVSPLTVAQAADPRQWAPRNSKITSADGMMYNTLYPNNTSYRLGTLIP